MKLRLLTLVAGVFALWGMVAYPLCYLGGEYDIEGTGSEGVLFSGVAAILCLIPTAATLLWCDLVLGKSPEQQLAAVLGGTGVRMAFVVGVALFLYYKVPEPFGSSRFWLWIIAFYLATLTLEMVLVVRRQNELDEAQHTKSHV